MEKSNSNEALDLYAEIEELLGIKEYSPKLYSYFFDILNSIEFNSLLDIGCGSGDFLLEIQNRYNLNSIFGIDRSSKMIEKAIKNGLKNKVSTLELKEIDKEFDIACATFDMVNYLTPQEFIEFFKDLKSVVKNDGYFIFDVNSEFGLSEIAVGNFIAEDDYKFLAIESFYDSGLYDSNFTLFKKNGNKFTKYSENISQYYYSEDFFSMLDGWEIVTLLPIKLYDMEKSDKIVYMLKNID